MSNVQAQLVNILQVNVGFFLCCLLELCIIFYIILCVLQATEMFLYFNRFFSGLFKMSEIKEIFFFIMWHVYCDFCFEVICFELKHSYIYHL